MATVTPVTSLPSNGVTSGAVQITGSALRVSVRSALGVPTIALIRMNAATGNWFRVTDSIGCQTEMNVQNGTGSNGAFDWSFTVTAAGANEYYHLLLTSGGTFTGTAEINSLSAPAIGGGAVPTSRTLTPAGGITIDGGTSAVDLSADRTFSLGGTADMSLSTGSLGWAGASGKTLSLVSNAGAMTLTAGAASTWKTSTGALTVDSAAALNLGTAAATSIAIGRGSITTAVTSAGANALAIGASGATNPAFNVDASTASSATGLNVKSAAAAAGVALSVISSGTNESLTIAAKGTGTVTFQPAVAVAAGGNAQSSILMSSTAALGVYFGSGAPTVSAAQGSLYIRTDGSSTSTRLYVNTNGSTTWTNVTTAA